MRSLFVAMIMMSASMAVVDTAQAQMQKPPGYGSMQAPIGHRQPTRDDLQPTQGDFEKIDKTICSSICRQARTELLGPARSRPKKTL
jgi:hypothetical protein